MSTVNDSPAKLVPESAEVEMDLFSSSDSLNPVSSKDIELCLWVLSQSYDFLYHNVLRAATNVTMEMMTFRNWQSQVLLF